MIKKIVFSLLLVAADFAMLAQQPRLPQVENYLEATGDVSHREIGETARYNLLETLVAKDARLMLNFPDMNDRGTREVMPFGYQLNAASQVKLVHVDGNMATTEVKRLYNKSAFTGVEYALCDSTVYGITFYFDTKDESIRNFVTVQLGAFFGAADYATDSLSVYSDADYLVKVGNGKVEAYSLFHYPCVEKRFPGVQHFYWEAPCHVFADGAEVSLAFYNQRTKENNMQLAFKLKMKTEKLSGMKSIKFDTGDAAYSYQLKSDFIEVEPDGSGMTDADMRVFLSQEDAKHILRSPQVAVTIEGNNGKAVSYVMPSFQKASLSTAFDYFRWNVTNAMVKYKGW